MKSATSPTAPPEERVKSGPGASCYVMAAFTHINPKGSRFSDGASASITPPER